VALSNLEMDAIPEECIGSPPYNWVAANNGMVNFWDDFITSIVTLVSNHVSTDAVNSMGDFLFGKAPMSDAAYDVLVTQPTYLAFFWIGVVISVCSLGGAIALLFPCVRNWSTNKISSKTMAITGTVLALVSFLVILFGTIMYLISNINPSLAETQPQTLIDNVKSNIDAFMGMNGQNWCFFNATFNPLERQANQFEQELIDNFDKSTGLTAMSQVDFTTFADMLRDNSTVVDQIKEDLGKELEELQNMDDSDDAIDEVAMAIEAFTNISTMLTIDDLPQKVAGYGNNLLNFQAHIAFSIQSPSVSIEGYAWDSIRYKLGEPIFYTIRSVEVAMYNSSSLIARAASQTGFASTTAKEVIDSGWIFPRWGVVVLFAVALIVALVAIIAGIIFSASKSTTPSKGVSCFMFILGIIMLALTCLVMIPTITGMTFGYGTQTSFDPFFYDSSLRGLQTMTPRLPNFTIPYMNASSTHGFNLTTSFGELMVSCKKGDGTFFAAVVGNDADVLDVQAFKKAIDVPALSNEFDNELHINNKIDMETQDEIYNSLIAIKNAPDLEHGPADDRDHYNIIRISREINEWKSGLEPYIDQWLDAYNYQSGDVSFTDLTNTTTIKEIINNEMLELLVNLRDSVASAGQPLHDNLYVNGESCSNLYRSYTDAADVATKEVAGPVQGMWAAAGLAGIFFIPLGISLLCIGNAFRTGSADYQVHDHSSPKPHAAAAPAATTPATSPAPHHQNTIAIALPTTRVDAAPAVPTRSTSRDPWQTTFIPTDEFAPLPVAHFVDPLALPAARVPTSPATAAAPPVSPGAYRGMGSPYPVTAPSNRF
ncbi:hypothetical protein PENTCL1PPCAC_9945, partial [Pristionchus entomophagus]